MTSSPSHIKPTPQPWAILPKTWPAREGFQPAQNNISRMKSTLSNRPYDGRQFLLLGLWLSIGGALVAGILFAALLVSQGGEILRRDDAPVYFALGAIALSLALGAWGALRLAYRTRAVDAALRERERDLEMAQAGGRIGSVIIDLGRSEWMLSKVGYEVLGVPGGSWQPLAEFAAMLAPRARAEAVKSMQDNIASGKRTSAEYEIVRPVDGKAAWIRVMTDTEFDESGKPLRRIGTVQDITEEKAAAARIVRLSRLYAALSKTNEAVLHAKDFDLLCGEACRIAVEEGGMMSSTIRVHDARAGTLVRVASHGPVEGLVGRLVIAVDDSIGVASATFRSRTRSVIERMADNPLTHPSAEDARRQGISAMACFPLLTQDQVFGTFSVFASDSTDLDERIIELLEEIAGAIAFARAKMAADQRIERLSSLYAALSRTNEAIVRTPDWHRLCSEVCRIIVDLGQVHSAAIRMVETATGALVPVGHCGPRGYGVERLAAVSANSQLPQAVAFREDRACVAADIASDPALAAYHELARSGSVSAIFAVPIRQAGKPAGVLSVFAGDHGHFDDELAGLYAELANDLSFASEKLGNEAAMRESEMRYRTVADASPDGIRVMQGARVVLVNPAYQRLVGAPSVDSLHGRDAASNLAPKWREIALSRMHQVLDRGRAVAPMEQEMQRDDGSVVPVEVVTMPFVYDGKPATLSILHDLTERRRAESALRERERAALEEIRAVNESLETRIAERTLELTSANHDLEAANRDLESFSYSVAHDLRAPLRSMSGFAKLLELDVADGDLADVSRHAERIIDNAARMNALVDGLLAVSRVTHGALREEAIDFAKMVAEIAHEANPGSRAGIQIGPLPLVRGDMAALRQVWSNLITNAVKYSAKGDRPVIRIGSGIEGDEVVFHVSDNGAGFDPAYASRLFGMFERLHAPNEFEGTGVGLAIVRRSVERHGGRVWAEGRPNQGATFHFSLPASRVVEKQG